jgi:hypothetical protein
MRMLKLRGELDLTLEPFGAQPFGEIRMEDLDDDFPLECRVIGDEDARHPAAPELLFEPVRAAQ